MTKGSEQDEQLLFNFDVCEKADPKLLSVDEIYSNADQELLTEIEEGRRYERKPRGIHQKELGTYVSMFANSPPDGGIIAVGVTDDGAFKGCKELTQTQINRVEQTAYSQCSDARCETKHVKVVNDKGEQDFVILLRTFYRQDKVVKTNGGEAYIRRGDSRHKLTIDEVRELERDKGQVQFEQEPCNLAYPDDFEIPLIHQWCSKVRASRRLEDETSDTKILSLFNLGKHEGDLFIPNMACAMLFSKNPTQVVPGCKIRFLRFEGEEMGTGDAFNPVKDEILRGRVPDLILQVEQILESQLRNFTRQATDGRFFTSLEYPKRAWYEAIVNACVHRSYGLMNAPIFVRMFDDRLEVASPGSFPPLVTPENIYNSHIPRNPNLMEAMWYMDFVKCANEGTKRMRNEMRKMELPEPEFYQHQGDHLSVLVTLRNKYKQRKVWLDADAAAVVGERIFTTLDERERQVINYLAEFEKISVSQTQRLTALSWPAAKKLLDGLVEQLILEHIHKEGKERDPAARFILRQSRKK